MARVTVEDCLRNVDNHFQLTVGRGQAREAALRRPGGHDRHDRPEREADGRRPPGGRPGEGPGQVGCPKERYGAVPRP